MNVATLILLLKGLDMLVLGIEMAPMVRVAFMNITASVRSMIDEGRDPTAGEWADLDILRDALHVAIQEAKPGQPIAHINDLRALDEAHMVVVAPEVPFSFLGDDIPEQTPLTHAEWVSRMEEEEK